MTRLRIEVPATSANLGPGFDTLALALDILDTVTVDLEPEGGDAILVQASGDAATLNPRDNLMCRAYRLWGEELDATLPGARFSLESRIPVGKGFGSSAASIVTGLAAAAFAAGIRDPQDQILRLAVQIEGHPDNVVAATLGGVTTAFCDGPEVHALTIVNHLTIGVGLFVPEERLQTRRARAAIPRSIPHADAVYNVGRVSYLTTALTWGKWELIGPAMQDRLHQPYRSRLVPALDGVIAAALEAGAYGAALSGGGPSVIALGPRDAAERFTAAMEDAAHRLHWPGTGLVTSVRHVGVQVKKEGD
jgi:homoserine kinase